MQKAQYLRETMNKLKSFCTAKESSDSSDSCSYSSDKGLIPRIYRELKKFNPQRINILKKK
jgi:hypothetical protein